MVVRCTRKMLDLLGGRSVTLVDLAPSDDDWYLNLLWLERRKCLLLTHSGTLFSVFRADIRSAALRPLGEYLVDVIESELRAEQLPIDTFSALVPDSLSLAKTSSRRTLGFMTEMSAELAYAIPDAGGLSGCDLGALNRRLRRTLHNRGRLRHTDRARRSEARRFCAPVWRRHERLLGRGRVDGSRHEVA